MNKARPFLSKLFSQVRATERQMNTMEHKRERSPGLRDTQRRKYPILPTMAEKAS